MQKLGLETFSLFSGRTVKIYKFSEFQISLIIEYAQVNFTRLQKVKYLLNENSDLYEILNVSS